MLTTIAERDQDRLMQKAARQICEKLREALAAKTQVNVAVCGGRNVSKIFEEMEREDVEWQRVHFFIVDERLVPIGHPDSNYKLLRDYLIDPLARAGRMPTENAHPFIPDLARQDCGAALYERVLAEYGMRYHVILLSSGEDGHVGALYPNHHSVMNRHHGFIVMHDSPKPPADRMTSTLSLMQSADVALILFVGEGKREAYKKFKDERIPLTACPAKVVLALKDVTVITDLD